MSRLLPLFLAFMLALAPTGEGRAEETRDVAELIPNAELDIFEGGHLFMLQDRRSRERTLEFLLA